MPTSLVSHTALCTVLGMLLDVWVVSESDKYSSLLIVVSM